MPSSHDSPNLELLHPRRTVPSGRQARPSGGWRLLHTLLGLALVLAVLGLPGCHKIFGEFHVDSDSTVGLCGTGTHRCVGAQLLECDASQNWDEAKVCLSEDRCDSSVGECHVCEAGMARCNLNWREVCAEDESGWEALQECDVGMCDPTCDCDHPDTCICVEGEFRCDAADPNNPAALSNVLLKCESDGTNLVWVEKDRCLNDSLCEAAVKLGMDEPESFNGMCPEPLCDNPNELRCTENELERCSQQRDMWNSVGQCATAELCQLIAGTTDPAVAAALTECVAVCSPALSFRCEGQQVLQCSETQASEDPIGPACPEGESCDVATGGCRKCTPGELRCNVAALERCDESYEWVLVEQCETRALCSVTTDTDTQTMQGECLTPSCVPTDFACDEATLLRCNTDQTELVFEELCGSNRLCNATDGRCEEPVCETDGDVECTATNTLRRCVDGRSRWDTVVECPADSFCNADPTLGGNCLTECPDPPVQCVGNVRRMCSDSTGVALWTVERTCSTPELCECVLDESCGATTSDGLCGEPVCGENLPDFNCDGATLQACTAGRDGWSLQMNCGSADLCQVDSDGDGGACLACPTADEVQCYNDNTARRTCSPDRRQWTNSQNCSYGCIENGTNDFCAACAAGELRCGSDGDLDVCASDRQTLEDEQSCPYTCVNRGNMDYCAVCEAGESRCNGSTTLDVCSTDLATLVFEETCAYSCIDDGSDDFCGTCQDGMEQCDGGNLETCADGVWGGGMQCTHGCIGDPSGPDYCAPDCDPDDYDPTCSDDDERVTCSDQGEFVTTACPGATDECIVVGSSGRCVECDPAVFVDRCNGANTSLTTCSSVGDEASARCPTSTPVCRDVDGEGECAECDPTTFPAACASSTSLATCSSDGELGSSACGSSTPLCLAGDCVECDPATFVPDCASSTSIETCSAGNIGSSACPSATPQCVAGDCVECNPDTFVPECASSTSVETCSDGNIGSSACGSSTPQCVDGDCVECNPATFVPECASSTSVETCSDGDIGSSACPSSTPQCVDGDCVECNPATFVPECASSTSVETCSDGDIGSSACPSSTPQCVDGDCVECNPDTFVPECASSTSVETCSDGDIGSSACDSPTPVCLDGDCVECIPPDTQCADSTSEQTCSLTGTWGAPVDCPNSAACTNDACETGVGGVGGMGGMGGMGGVGGSAGGGVGGTPAGGAAGGG